MNEQCVSSEIKTLRTALRGLVDAIFRDDYVDAWDLDHNTGLGREVKAAQSALGGVGRVPLASKENTAALRTERDALQQQLEQLQAWTARITDNTHEREAMRVQLGDKIRELARLRAALQQLARRSSDDIWIRHRSVILASDLDKLLAEATPALPPEPPNDALIERAREAVGRLRDAARTGCVMDFRQRDPLVMTIHEALDQAEARAGRVPPEQELK